MKSLPIAIPTKSIEERHQAQATNFTKRAATLAAAPLTLTTAHAAAELDKDAKDFLKIAEAERVEIVAPLLTGIRKVNALFRRMTESALRTRQLCTGFGLRGDGGIVGRFNAQEQRRIEANAKSSERVLAQHADALQAAEIAHLIAIGDQAGAALLAETPPPAPMIAPEEAVTVSGVATIEKRYGTVEDAPALLAWLLDGRQEMIPRYIDFRMGDINRDLNRGIEPRGVSIALGVQNQNRRRD